MQTVQCGACSRTAISAASCRPAVATSSISRSRRSGIEDTEDDRTRALLNDAVTLFRKTKVDSIVVVDGARPVGVLDVQDLIKLGLLGQEHL